MNVSLNPHFDQFIQRQLKAGNYNSASEVIRDGLRLLEQQQTLHEEKLKALRNDIQEASESLQRGEGLSSGEEVFQRLHQIIDRSENSTP